MPSGYTKPREIICGGCQEPFMATGSRSRFCSRKCLDKERWDRIKRKEIKCRTCKAIVVRNYSRTFCSLDCKNKWYSSLDPGRKESYIKQRYNLTITEYNAILASQNYRCAICQSDEEDLHIDHDHACCPRKGRSCGKCIRGLLCHSCNNGLGRFKDSIEVLEAAAEYLRK